MTFQKQLSLGSNCQLEHEFQLAIKWTLDSSIKDEAHRKSFECNQRNFGNSFNVNFILFLC